MLSKSGPRSFDEALEDAGGAGKVGQRQQAQARRDHVPRAEQQTPAARIGHMCAIQRRRPAQTG